MSALLDIGALAKRFDVGGKRLLYAVDEVSFAIGRGETVGPGGRIGLRQVHAGAPDQSPARPDLGPHPPWGHRARRLQGAAPSPANANRARIQMVFQDAGDSLNPRFTASDAIADPLRRLKKMSGAALTRRVEALADMTGLPRALLSRFPHQLSGGQKARVGIARAIAVEPELLILDEPTAALDVSVQVVILQLLQTLKRELGMSYLFVSHDLNVVRLLCDRVLVMYLGKIVEAGPAAEVFADPKHPYTRALISAIPQADPDKRIGRLRLCGEPRSPIDPDPTVCRFYGRCPKGEPRCSSEMPLLRDAGPARQVACHFA